MEAFGAFREDAERDLERGGEPAHGSPGRILAAAFQVGDPGWMQGRAVRELFLAEAALDPELSEGRTQSRLRFGSARHPPDRADAATQTP